MVKIKYMEDIMFETLTIDVTNVKKILKCCPYYDDIINSDIMYNDDLSIDLIEWYKDIIFSCNGDNEEDIKIIRNIDRCMYIYINDNKYKKGLKKRIINNDINLNDNYKEVVNKTQYIHSNKPNIENNDLTNEINKLIKELEKENYNMVSNDIDWNIYENADKNTKIAAFTPIKYGMCWYE
mgnify:CR=1 FL=1